MKLYEERKMLADNGNLIHQTIRCGKILSVSLRRDKSRHLEFHLKLLIPQLDDVQNCC